MNARQILESRRKKAPTQPVKVRLFSKEDGGSVAEGDAVLVFLPDSDRLRMVDAAAQAVARQNVPASDGRHAAEESYHILSLALREADAPDKVFFASVEDAKALLAGSEAMRLRIEYDNFLETHFPVNVSAAEVEEIREAAKTHFLGDLMTSFGYWRLLRSLPSLARTYGALPQ